ncbi:MAG: hypothetical protein E7062_00915 [Spirochaetaceae bacterium]|nr:hypothetical protein [Spirochaetaceae bacterium]
MKKNILGLLIALVIFATSCSDSLLLYQVSQEIDLEKHTVVGNVYTMISHEDYIYALTGKIQRKNVNYQNKIPGTTLGSDPVINQNAGKTAWEFVATPENKLTSALASDGENIYALIVDNPTTPEVKDITYSLYYTENPTSSNPEWKKLFGNTQNIKTIFDNGATSENKKAFISYKKGDSFEIFSLTPTFSSETLETAEEAPVNTIYAVYAFGKTIFSTTRNITVVNDSYVYKSTSAKKLSFLTKDTAIFDAETKNYNWNDSLSISDLLTPHSLLFYQETEESTPYLLVGTISGLDRIVLDAQYKPTGKVISGYYNSQAQFGSYYVIGLYSFPTTEANAPATGNIYAATREEDSSDYSYLWGFYPERGNWNCE